MRRRARKDSNHAAIVAELRQLGCSVLELHQLGDDKPDLVVGFQGITALVELKPAGRAYTPDADEKARAERQADFLAQWRGGPAFIATSTADIVSYVRAATPYRTVTRGLEAR